MTETLTHGYSSESTQRELSNEYKHERVQMVFKKSLRNKCSLDESRLIIGRVKSADGPQGIHVTSAPFNHIEVNNGYLCRPEWPLKTNFLITRITSISRLAGSSFGKHLVLGEVQLR